MKKAYDRWNRILSIILVCVMIAQTCFSSVIYGAEQETAVAAEEDRSVDENEAAEEEAAASEAAVQSAEAGQTASAAEGSGEAAESAEAGDSEATGAAAVEESEQLPAADTADMTNGDSAEDLNNISNEENAEVPEQEEELFSDGAVQAGTEDSEGKLTLQENETKTMDLNADKTLTGIELGTGSELTVNTNNNKFTVTGDITGTGKLILKGNNIHVRNISVSDLAIEGAEVDTKDSENNIYKIEAADSLTVKNSKISNAAFLGYKQDATGEKTLVFDGTGNDLHNISRIGTDENGRAAVTITGASSISTVSDTNFCCDYRIAYFSGDKALTPGENWPVFYRVKYTGNISASNGTICGYYKAGTEQNPGEYTSVTEITLPSYTEEGYTYKGWTVGDGTDVITSVQTSASGALNLKASLEAVQVTVMTDLGYDPTADTNDDYANLNRNTTVNSSWGKSVTLSTPSRFGYEFARWKVVKQSETGEENNAATYQDSYTTALSDAVKDESGNYTITLEAQWSAKSFPFRFFVKDADVTKMKIKVDENEYGSVSEFATQYASNRITWNSQTSQLELPDISYDETLDDYIKRIGLTAIPELVDARSGQEKQEFRGWTTPGGKTVSGDMKFAVGEILDNRSADVKLADYEKSITSTSIFLTSAWGTTEYTFSIEETEGWELLVGDEVQKLNATGTTKLKIAAGSMITLRCSALTPKNFSLWDFTEGFLPEETKYSSGAEYLCYEAVMPYKDVTATYSKDAAVLYVDIAQGAVTFEQNVTLPSGRKADGFWYPSVMKSGSYTSGNKNVKVNALSPVFQQKKESTSHAEEYFYIWDSKTAFRITTQKHETKNQLTVTEGLTVYMLDCNMTATDVYRELSDTKIGDVQLEDLSAGDLGKNKVSQLENAGISFRDYGNIVADTTTDKTYTLNLRLEGDSNVIACITTDGFHALSAYTGVVSLSSADTSTKRKVSLGTVFGDFDANMSNVAVEAYAGENNNAFQYLIYTANSATPIITNCTVNAANKRIFTFASEIRIEGNSQVYIRELKCYYNGVKFSGNSYTRIYGDVYSDRHALNLSSHASVVIDGNVMTTNQDNYANGTIDTTGYLIVKGTVFDASNMTINKGTVICNVFEAGESLTISGGTVITNMITGNLYNRLEYDESSERYKPAIGSYSNVGYVSRLSSNGDDYPFIVFSGNAQSQKTYTFGGGQVYLLGYYKTEDSTLSNAAGKKQYNLNVVATGADNPVSKYITECIDDNGNLKNQISIDCDVLKNEISTYAAQENTTNTTQSECIILGNSTYTPSTNMPRYALISGSSIYAKGNITFFNDTTVSGGTIVCTGSFGTKADLSIGGGSITADTVGNVCDLTTTKTDLTKTWKKTSVTGGTINAKMIGARDSYGYEGSAIPQRSLLEISDDATVKATLSNVVELRSDEYINYIYDKNVFPENKNEFANLQNNIRLTATSTSGIAGTWTTEGIQTITQPKLSDDTVGEWAYDSLSGRTITGIDTNCTILPAEADSGEKMSIQGKDSLRLYAVKKQYTLTRVYGDSHYNIAVENAGGASVSFNQASMTDISDLSSITVNQATVATGTDITLSITETSNPEFYKARTVVWYKDANGQYHNALAGCSWDNDNRITFSMPKADCYIYGMDDSKALPLDLSASGLSFTKNGFITEFATVNANGSLSADADRTFTYAGNYRIVQSNINAGDIEKIGEEKDGYGYPRLDIESAKRTGNRIVFATDFDNTGDSGQKITVSRVFQHCKDTEFGTLLENSGTDSSTNADGAKVRMELDGNVAMFRFQIKEHTALTLAGHNGLDNAGAPRDTVYFNKAVSNIPSTYLTNTGNNDGKTGDFTVESLNVDMMSGYGGYLIVAKEGNQSGSFTMKNCRMTKKWGDSTGLARNISKVTLEACDFDISTNSGYTTALFEGCKDVTISGKSKLQWKNIGSINTGGFFVDHGISGTLIVNDSEITMNFDSMTTAGTYKINPTARDQAPKVILENNAVFTADTLASFRSLEVNSNAKLNVKQQENGTEETWLFCKDIQVNGGSITADNVIVSGFYEHYNYNTSASNKAALDAAVAAGYKYSDLQTAGNKGYMVEGNTGDATGLKIMSGSVTATNFVGGDWNGKIEVSGGTLKAPAIGTSGYLYGFVKQLPANKKDYVYRYPILDYSSKYIEAATVTVKKNGVIQVPDNGYLGGMRCTVDIQGGKVQLGNGAVLGMTDAQKDILAAHYSSRGDDIRKHTDTNCKVTASGGRVELAESSAEEGSTGDDSAKKTGDISVPYGSISLSGTVKAKVTNISAECGSIEITQTSDGYTNPYNGGEGSSYKKSTVAIWVLNTLSAQNLTLKNGAQVYAQNAYAVVEHADGKYNGGLTVTEAGLYAASYGEKGVSRTEDAKKYNDKSNANDQTVFGTRLVSVSYVLNPQNVISDDDLEGVVNESPENYTVTSDEKNIDLTDASCRGYNFLGWYTNPECTGDKATQLKTTIANDLILYAKWEKIQVKFQIMMDSSSSSYYNDSEFTGNANWTTGSDSNSYISTKTVTLAYGEKILTVSGVNLMDYITNTLGITELEIQASDYSGTKVINADSIVSRELAEYYKSKAKDNTDAVIVLHVKNVQKRIAAITFDVNKRSGKPSDATFSDGKTTIRANVSVDMQLGQVAAFKDTDSTDADSEDNDSADNSSTDEKSPGLIRPSATGYTFIGWNTNADATKATTDGWVKGTDKFAADTTIYAVWQANTYLITFDAGEGSWVTSGNSEPAVGAAESKKLNYYWIYDTPVTEDNSFWLKDQSSDKYMTEMPYAWREGYVFDHDAGWTYSYKEDDTTKIQAIRSTEELSKLAVSALDTAAGDPNGTPRQVALTITASYTPVKVSYELNGGKWQNNSLTDEATPGYGDALAGYVKKANGKDTTENSAEADSADNQNEEQIALTTGENGSSYYVASTTSTYYSTQNSYVTDDYRNVLRRKGYTFYGWYTSQEEAEAAVESGAAGSDDTQNKVPAEQTLKSVGTTPRFRNVELYAAWKANTYTLKVNNKDSSKTYSYTAFKVPSGNTGTGESSTTSENDTASVEVSATTGQEIAADNWPSRETGEAWYIHNAGEAEDNNTSRRYFLGATFAALDPGASSSTGDTAGDGKTTYEAYVKAVTAMENNGTLYMGKTGTAEGTVLTFPEDDSYRKDLEGVSENTADNSEAYTVPDYPAGCTIDMYAVYREQSIVFVERYIDKDGNEQQNILHTASWDKWSDYPTKYGEGNREITSAGYSLIGWYVNSVTADQDMRYPAVAGEYSEKLESYKTAAANNHTYDIMVYTVYTSQITRSVTLDAKQDPVSDTHSTDSYRLPASMQKGNLSMEITEAEKLNFVSKDAMEVHQYDLTWTDAPNSSKKYTSDDTVAVVVSVTSADGQKTKVSDLSKASNGTLDFENLQIGAGDQVTLTLYHSRVMTKEQTYSFTLKTCFSDGNESPDMNTLKDQYIRNQVSISMKPSLYTVNYTVQLPEALENLTIQKKTDSTENWGDFSRPEQADTKPINTVTRQVKADYGSSLLNALPSIEGYTVDGGWKVSADGQTGSETASEPTLYTELKMPVSAQNNGVINLTEGYTVQQYKLSADSEVLKYWGITYSDGRNTGTDSVKELSAGTGSEAGNNMNNAEGIETAAFAIVKYHSEITFTAKGSEADPSEFVTLNLDGNGDGDKQTTVKLPDYAKMVSDNNTSTYTFTMPAENITGTYVTTETLYLDDGTISVTETGYTQSKTAETTSAEKTWRGNYEILQNAKDNAKNATANVLILSGDLSGRTINLGNLNISSPNSIELRAAEGSTAKAAKAVLTQNAGSAITAKNIKAPSGTELTVNGTTLPQTGADSIAELISSSIKLFPEKTAAAIGGTAEPGNTADDSDNTANSGNGTVTLNKVKLELFMPAGSEASGIGPVKRDSTVSGAISLNNCSVTVEEGSTNETYKGVWIGGNTSETVKISNTVLMSKNDNHMAGPVITAGKTVTIENSQIGTAGKNVSDPVYAVNTLNIINSQIYINIQDNISNQSISAPIGTSENGTTNISSASTIKIAKAGGNAAMSALYSGILKIQDAASNVLIDGYQIIEVSNGEVILNGNAYTQGNNTQQTDTARRNYILLEEKLSDDSTNIMLQTNVNPDLTVKALPEKGTIEVRQPKSRAGSDTNAVQQDVTIGNLNVQADAELILNGNLNVTGTATIGTAVAGADNTLTADATTETAKNEITLKVSVPVTKGENTTADSYGILFEASDTGNTVFAGASGNSYIQNGGSLKCENADFSDGSLNVTLKDVISTVKKLYARNLTVENGSVTSTATTANENSGEIGSKPEDSETTATTVSIKNASVTAGTIGALGTYDKTFTSVITENATLNGKLVQDHYRIKYDIGKASNLKTDSLNRVFRTETAYTGSNDSENAATIIGPTGGIPGKPTEDDSTENLFGCWYINTISGAETDKTTRKALAAENATLPAGLKERTILAASTLSDVSTADISDNSDGTKTLTVHAWLKPSGTTAITKGRVFKTFGADSDSTNTISIQSNGTWTAMLISTGTAIEGRDYRVTFKSVLPVGTTLTLTEPAADNKAGKYYYYKVAGENISSVKFSDFTVMGGDSKFQTVTETENIPESETFLLSVDFANAKDTVGTEQTTADQTVSFRLIPEKGSEDTNEISMGTALSYNLTAVSEGQITFNETTLSVSSLPADSDRLDGKKLFVKAVIETQQNAQGSSSADQDTIPYGITANWNGKIGVWISRDTVLFELENGNTGTDLENQQSGELKLTGLENGTYKIACSLVYGASDGAATDNIAGNVISNVAELTYTEAHIDPSIKVITDSLTSRVIKAGEETSVTLAYTVSGTNKVGISAEKQNALCEFKTMSNTIDSGIKITQKTDSNEKTATLTFKKDLSAGTYRICFSIDESSERDNAYITFIVK